MQPRGDNTIAEGIATTTLEIIFPHDAHFACRAPSAGSPHTPDPPDLMQRIAHAGHNLRSVSANVAILYYTGQINRDQALDYMVTYGLSSPGRAAKGFQFFTSPLFRSYIFTYTYGYDLITAANGDKTSLFLRLLTEQLLLSHLTATS